MIHAFRGNPSLTLPETRPHVTPSIERNVVDNRHLLPRNWMPLSKDFPPKVPRVEDGGFHKEEQIHFGADCICAAAGRGRRICCGGPSEGRGSTVCALSKAPATQPDGEPSPARLNLSRDLWLILELLGSRGLTCRRRNWWFRPTSTGLKTTTPQWVTLTITAQHDHPLLR